MIKLILPLDAKFPLKTKRDRVVKYSLNEFLIDITDASSRHARMPNHYYQHAAKVRLQHSVEKQLASQPALTGTWPKKVSLHIYRASNRHMDIIDNPVILIKFAMDVVKIDHAPDDDWRYFSEAHIIDKGVDKENPRAELTIEDIS